MADDDYDAAKKALGAHLKIVQKSCSGMKAFANGLKSKTDKLIGAMDNKGEVPAKQPEVSATGASEQ